MKLQTKIKQNRKEYLTELIKLPSKLRFEIYLISLLFTLFFISAPVAIIINLYLFVDYFNLVSLGVSIILFLAFNTYYLIFFSILKRKFEHKFSFKYLIIDNIIRSFLLSTLLFFIIIFIIKGLVI